MVVSTASGSGDNSQESNLPYQDNHSSLVIADKVVNTNSENSIFISDTEPALFRRDQVLNLFRKTKKVSIPPAIMNLKKSGS